MQSPRLSSLLAVTVVTFALGSGVLVAQTPETLSPPTVSGSSADPLVHALQVVHQVLSPQQLDDFTSGAKTADEIVLDSGLTLGDLITTLTAHPAASGTLSCHVESKSVSGTAAGLDCAAGVRTGGGCTVNSFTGKLTATLPNTSNGWSCFGQSLLVIWVVCCTY